MANFSNLIESSRFALARDGQRRLQPVVIIGALLFTALVAYVGTSSQLVLLMAGLIGLGGMLILQRWPPLGLVILVFGGMVIPYVGPAGLNASLALAAGLLILWIADMVIVKRQIKLVSSRTLWPLLALVMVACISFISGQFSWFSFARNAPLDAQLGGLSIYVLSAAAFLLVAHQIRDIRWLQAMVWVFLFFGTLFFIARAFPPAGVVIGQIIQPGAIGGVFYAWFPALAFGQAVFNRDLHPFWRVVLLGMVALCVYVGFFKYFDWKSGWMPTMAAIGVITYFRTKRAGLFVLLLAAIAVIPLIPEWMASDDYSISTRWDAWIIMAQIIKVNPILGLGIGNYYWYTPLFAIRGWTVTFNSHNNFIDIVAQIGLLGLACFLWFFWEAGRLGWQLRDRVPDGFARAYVYCAISGLVATLVAAMLGDWLLSFVYNVGLAGYRTGVVAWLFLGGLVAIQNIYKIDLQPIRAVKSE
jgi:hypothetical protein